MKTSRLKVFIFLAVISILLVTVISCSGGTTTITTTDTKTTTVTQTATTTSGSTTSTTTQTGGQQRGGVLKMIIGGTLGNPNIGWPAEAAWHIMTQYGPPALETLVREDDKLQIQPWLATDWEIADDRTSITLNLRQGVKFHDGTDLNADAVKFNYEAVMAAKLPLTKYWKSVEVVDTYTIRINLTGWENTILSGLASSPGGLIVSPTAYEKNGKNWAMTNPVGTGAFIIDEVVPDVKIVYKKNPNYWQDGKPYLDGIEFLQMADPQAALLAFQAGTAHTMVSFDLKQQGDLKAMGAGIIFQPDGIVALNPDGMSANSPFKDKLVRQALEYAVNREAIANSLGNGFLTVEYQWAMDWTNGYVPDLPKRAFDQEKAKELIAQAGFSNGFECKVCSNIYPEISQVVQGSLQDIGIDATIWDLSQGNAYVEAQVNGWPNALFIATDSSFPNFLQSVSQLLMTPNYYVSLYRPPELEEMYKEAISTTTIDPEKVKEISRLVFEEAVIGPLLGHGIARCVSPKVEVHDIGYHTQGDNVFAWTPENCWMKMK